MRKINGGGELMSLKKSADNYLYCLTKRFDDALLWASNIHAGQFRKGTTTPYISHLLAVASIVMEITDDEELAIAALLHDAPEDRGGRATLKKINLQFGEKVKKLVEECSDTLEFPKPDSAERKTRYIQNLPNISEDARMISLADKLHNARSIYIDYKLKGEQFWESFNVSKNESINYYRELCDTYTKIGFQNKKAKLFLEELDRMVEEIEKISKGA